jgi:hypothetical protein
MGQFGLEYGRKENVSNGFKMNQPTGRGAKKWIKKQNQINKNLDLSFLHGKCQFTFKILSLFKIIYASFTKKLFFSP